MKEIAVISIWLVALTTIFAGCKKDNNDPETTFELLAEQVIGPEGGSFISSDHLIMDVPAGAFSNTTTLQLFYSDEENPYTGDGGASDVIYIKGFPDDLAKPVRVAVKHDGSATKDAYVAMGFPAIATATFDTVFGHKLYPATDSSGYLVCMILPEEKNGRDLKGSDHSHQGRYGVPFFCIRNLFYLQTDHFLIYYNSGFHNLNTISSLAGGLEDAYALLKSWDFSYDSRTSWPVYVEVKPLNKTGTDENLDGLSLRGIPYTKNSGYLEIGNHLINDHNLLRITGGHEFFHLVQDLYNYDEKYNWLQEASSTWFESYLTLNPSGYVPVNYTNNRLQTFLGVRNGTSVQTETLYGYGSSAILNYLMYYNNQINHPRAIRYIWDAIAYGKPPVEALVSYPIINHDWWNDFIKEHYQGNLFNDSLFLAFNNNYFIDGGNGGKWDINTEADVEKEFNMLGWSLSGDVFRIDPNYLQLTQGSTLTVTNDGALTHIFAFRYNNTPPRSVSLIGESASSLTVSDLKDFVDTEDLIYIVASTWINTPSYVEGYHPYTLQLKVANDGVNYYETTGFVQSYEYNAEVIYKISTPTDQKFRVIQDRMDTNDQIIKKMFYVTFNNPPAGTFYEFNVECEVISLSSSFPGTTIISNAYMTEYFSSTGDIESTQLPGPYDTPFQIVHRTDAGGYCTIYVWPTTDQGAPVGSMTLFQLDLAVLRND